MKRIVVAVDGTAASMEALRTVVQHAMRMPLELELVNVQPRLHRHIADRLPASVRHAWRDRRAREALGPAERIAAEARVPFRSHALVGPAAARVLRCARETIADEIVVGAARRGPLGRWLANSLSGQLLEKSPIPVRVVPAGPAPLLERIALPAGLGLVALLLLADE